MNVYDAFVKRGTWKQNMYNDLADFSRKVLGYTQYRNTQDSLSAQIDYDQYIRRGNERALRDWHKNVPNRNIKYPELSYEGQIRRADTSIARAGFDYATADANYYGNLPYRVAGLYGIGSRVYRSL
nr:MAG: ORF3 protein [Canine associated porprismacovirus]